MKVDFWQLSRDPAERVVALIARRVLGEGERLLVVAADERQRQAIARELWQAGPETFLANGEARAPGAERQPILLSADCRAANGASHLVLADGVFRETEGFARLFLLFDEAATPDARKAWRALDGREGLERSYFSQDSGRWEKKA